MSTSDLPVQDLIAQVLAEHDAMSVDGWRVKCTCGLVIGTTQDAGLVEVHDRHIATAVVAAIQGATVEQQRDLLDGYVETIRHDEMRRAVGPWREDLA